ncbi:endonuclease MutS2 [Ferviditalea candida]|uniref:Endonuclease MutS2 n=1 Tax=Ferviditalea candida TaxID=3108399 RepID=A0ABU5ZFT8_9BACL|nr:endonuclease MutS2 [Paenibacillaceae bacterium T2]
MKDKILSVLEYPKILHKLTAHAATEIGKTRAERLRPSHEFSAVRSSLQATDEAFAVQRLKGGAPFGGIRDIRGSLQRARIGGALNPAELLDIATTISGGRKLKRFLFSFHENHPIPMLQAWAEGIAELNKLEEGIAFCINDQAEVSDQASPELNRIRHERRTGEHRVRERLEQMLRTPSVQKMLQESLVTVRNDRYVIPVKQEYRGSIGGIVHDQSASGATLFIEPEAVVQLNNKLRELSLKEQKEIEKILRQLTEKVAEFAEELRESLESLAELDFQFAKAALAKEMKASLPIMNDSGFIQLKKARHPLITGEAVPINVELGREYSTIIITGPNTGGKTVSLKTIGLLSLMAMSGLFIPAEDGSSMCVFEGIYADIGDEQSIEQNLSTFSSHMTNIIGILRSLTPNSLILLDELGAGTDPAEGSALAIAILEHIHSQGCRMVATTHYSELKAYAYDRPGIINASMEFDVQTLRPTYRLLVGVPGRSNAFAIARRLGLPEEIIERARGQINEETQRVESMIASLEENRLTAETERQSAQQLRREMDRLRRELEQERTRFEEQRDKMLQKAEQEARDAVAKARREAEEIIADLRRLAMEERAAVKEHKLLEAKKKLDEAVPALRKTKAAARNKSAAVIEPGDEVLVASLGQKGHVVEIAGDGAVVQLGIMKMKVGKADIEPVAAPKPQKQYQPAGTGVKRTRDEHIRTELDLRGANLEDSLLEVDRFLDEAILANLGRVSIIHGKGTGVLRNGIQEYLRRHKHVQSYRLGNFNEGGTGVTLVELK